MVPPKTLLDIAQKIQSIVPGLSELHEDVRENTREAIMAALMHLDLVSREEFDAQAQMLARMRTRLDTLEKQVAAWEERTQSE